jgi:MFS family permease
VSQEAPTTGEAAPGAGQQDPAPPGSPALRRALVGLCVTEITSWGVLFYAFPVLLVALTDDTGWSTASVTTAFSVGLVVSALAGVPVGRLLDRHGPRPVMTAGSVAAVGAVLLLAAAPTLAWFFAAWVLVGLVQATVLYPPAFAALTRWYGPHRVRALTILALAAGLSSTLFAPLTALLVGRLGWRGTYVALAVLLGAVTIPLHAWTLTPAWPAAPRHVPEQSATRPRRMVRSRAFLMLAVALALSGLGLHAATISLVPLFVARGSTTETGATALALCGAGQLLGRLGYPTLSRRTSPRARTVVVFAACTAAVAALAAMPGPVPLLVAVATVAGAVRGAYTLVLATAVSDRWGTDNFATLNALVTAPAQAAIAVSPAAGALLATWFGGYPAAFYALAVLSLAGVAAAAGTAPRRDHAAS